VGEQPAFALIRQLLNPVIIVLMLFMSTLVHDHAFDGPYRVLAVLAFIVGVEMLGRPRLESLDSAPRLFRDLRRVVFQWSCAVALLLFLGFVLKVSGLFSRKIMLTWFLVTPAALLGAQLATRRAMTWLVDHGAVVRKQVIVGANDLAYELAQRLAEDPCEATVLGFFDDRRLERLPGVSADRLLGRFTDLAAYVRRHGVQVIYICLPISAQPRIRALLQDLRDTTASIYFVPDVFAFDLIQARFGQVKGVPVMAICETPFCGLNGVLKRGSDILLAIVGLLLAAPLMVAIAIAVKRSSPGPILFRQRRYGLQGEEFVVYKFRTMKVCEDGGEVRQARQNDPRATAVGRFLRRTSLDELPQLYNVLEGTMSLVGPRPHAVAHNEHYRKLVSGYMLRHKVRPGITGWAQVNGLRGETANLEKMRLRVQFDLDYLRHWSLALDLYILLRTAFIVLRDRNAY
jgi:putative colanic acid biosynthesis UDP-glucose lipid carrier transferase